MTADQTSWCESAFIPYEAESTCPPGPVLVLAPHADDEVLGCGGAILRHLATGDAVSVIIAADSDYGKFAAGEDGRAVRRREALNAAAVLGYGTPSFWGLPDRGLVYDERLIGQVLEAVEQAEAEILYAPSWWEMHPDHCVLALAAVEALRRCSRSVTLAMYEVGVPLHPNLLLDISDLSAQKQAAMACYESQLRMQRYDQHLMALNRFRAYTLPAKVDAAEAFRLLRADDIRQDPLRAIRPGLYYAQSGSTLALVTPLVSVMFIGGRAALADALDSVMLQTYAHLEIVVVQDRGLGEPGLVHDLDPWREGRFHLRIIDTHGPMSQSERANLAMAHAGGEWLLFLGEGDSLEPNHVATLMQRLASATLARCVCAGVRMELDQNGGPSELDDWHPPPEFSGPYSYGSVPLDAVLLARSLFEGGCRFDTELDDCSAVWDFWLQLSSRNRWLVSSEVSARHRHCGTSPQDCQHRRDFASPSARHVIKKWLMQCYPENIAQDAWNGQGLLQQTVKESQVLRERTMALERAINEIQILNNERAAALDRAKSFERAHNEIQALNSERAAALERAHNEIQILNNECGAALDRAKSFERAHNEIQALNSECAVALAVLSEQAAALQAALKGEMGSAETLRNELAACASHLATQQRLAAEREGLCLDLQQHIDTLLGSTSWRLTRPLRTLALYFRRALGPRSRPHV
jgi:LmbE family N-acetylglucosaminyl deacetylase